MSLSDACCNTPPVESKIEPKGEIVMMEGLQAYVVGDKSSKKSILVLYDIFGLHENTKLFCDNLAKAGYRVVMPDYLGGNPFTMEDLTGPRDALMAKITKASEPVLPHTERVRDLLKSEGVTTAGMVGFCWGGKMATHISAKDSSFFSAISAIHPSFIAGAEDVEAASVPVLLLPSKDEKNMPEFFEILKAKPFGDKCEFYSFDNMHHGFAAARADLKNQENKECFDKAIELTIEFFNKNVAPRA